MKITAVRLLRIAGTIPTNGPLWEERLVRPIDIYPEYRDRDDFEGGVQEGQNRFRIEQHFLRIETDQGVHGIGRPALGRGRRLRRPAAAPDPDGPGPDRA